MSATSTSTVYFPPECKVCGSRLLRWSWWEWEGEDVTYWYCLECDKSVRIPYIFVVDRMILKEVIIDGIN